VRPLYAGDELTCVCTIAEITERGGAGFLTTRTDVMSGEEIVVTATARLVVRPEGDR
jgi:acyl dehydratase